MNKIIRYVPVVTIMIIIFMFSNQPADDSTKVSDSFILSIAHLLNLNIIPDDNITHIVRKSAHFTIYLLLGLAVINLIITYRQKMAKTIIISIIVCLLYAISDEIHQMFIPGRSAEIIDICIDTLGATIGIILYKTFYKSNNLEG